MPRILLALCLGLAIGFTAPRELGVVGHAASPGRFAQFAGHWTWHSGIITVDQSGHGSVRFRTYVNCTQTIVTDCDYFQGNYIYSGGFAVFYLWKVQANKAYGSITNSAFSYQFATTVTLVRKANDTLLLHDVGILSAVTGCGPHTPAGQCGA